MSKKTGIFTKIGKLELSQYKNDSTERKESASFEIAALFTRLYSEGKSAAILKQAEFGVLSCRSYNISALGPYV